MNDKCMRFCAGICKADGQPCIEPCVQFVSFDGDLFDELTSNMSSREKESSRKPCSTWYEILKGTASSAATRQERQNRYAVQNLLTIEQATQQDKEAIQVEEVSKWGF